MSFIFFLLLSFSFTNAHADTTTGLIGWWKFNEGNGTSAFDSSGRGNNGTLQNSPSWINSCPRSAQCLSFNGSNQYVSVAQNGNFNLSAGPFTVAAWTNSTIAVGSINPFQRIISWYDGSKNIQLGLAPDSGNTNRVFYIQNDVGVSAVQAASTGNQALGAHHVAATFDGSATYNIYVDGVNLNGGTVLNNLSTAYSGDSTTLYIGQRGNGAYFNGTIDDVRIYNRALSAMDVYALYLNDNKIRNATFKNVAFK